MRSVDGYDAIVLSPHKFLGGPGSPGILLMNKALYQLKNFPPSTCGGGTINYVNFFNEKDTIYVDDIEEREDAGTSQIIQRVKAALAFQVKEYIGCEVIAEKEHDYIQRALERLFKNKNIRVLGNTKGYTGSKSGWTRISFPYYVPNEEYEFILFAIEFIGVYGQRFLPFYLFNWKTGSWKLKANALEEALQKVKGCKTTANVPNDHLAKSAFYLEVARHIGDLLPEFSSGCNIPEGIINPNNVLFKV